MSHLSQQGGFPCTAKPGDDHSMRDVPRRFHLGQLSPNNTGLQVPEELKLFEHHTLDLIFGPARCPRVVTHTEIIPQIVFSVNENYLANSRFIVLHFYTKQQVEVSNVPVGRYLINFKNIIKIMFPC